MNERIKQLAEQASHQSPDGYPVTIPYSKDFAEKFAELIVRECDRVIKESVSTMEHGKMRANIAYAGSLIKEHFGVKE